MLKRYFHKRERYFAMLNANRIVRPFEWGTEFVLDNPNGTDPRSVFSDNSRRILADSDSYFFRPNISDFELRPLKAASTGREEGADGQPHVLTWTSAIETS